MYEIKVADLATNSPDFGVVRRTVLDRYDRLYRQHVTGGRLTYRRDASQRDLVAGTYTSIVLNHAQVATGAFRSELYASGFTLIRSILEAVLKQYAVCHYDRDDDGWKDNIVASRLRVTKGSLKKFADRGGPDFTHLWKSHSPWLNDFIHGGFGQLSSNNNLKTGAPHYPASWFWAAMIIATQSMLISSILFWTHMGRTDRAAAVLHGMESEPWCSLEIMHNGQGVRIMPG